MSILFRSLAVVSAVSLWTCASPGPAAAQQLSSRQLTEPPVTGWPTNGGNLYNQRYSPLDEIDVANVALLKGEWHAHLDGSGVGPPYSGEAQPIVDDGIIYIPTGADDVFALDVESGKPIWVYEAHLDPAISTVCCGWTSRGVGMGEGKIFLGRLDGRLAALDAKTGSELWSVQAERWQDGYTITSAPLYYDGMVITGFAGAEFATRGRVKAFRARDGVLLWTFYTVPGPGAFGHDSWPAGSDAWQYGGGSVWQTPAVDPELGLVYFATGNPGPDFRGAVRAGDNLFTASIVAIEARTGTYRWHFQQVHHDLWDYDSANPVVLFDLEIDGRQRKGIAHSGKTGWVYLLDRVTGEPLIGIEERPVMQEPRQATAATQPFPVGEAVVPQSIDIPPYGYRLLDEGRIFTPYWTDPIVVKPGPGGGGNWPPSSYDPRRGLMFVCANDEIGLFMSGDAGTPVAGERYMGSKFGMTRFPVSGIFAAVDLRSNTVAWRQRWHDSCYSGSTATAGNLVFTGRNDGRFVALDARNGDVLWEFQTGAGVNATASVFQHEGKQKIVVYAAGNLFAGSPPGDSVWLFSRDGTLGPVQSPGPVGEQDVAMGDADADAGLPVYAQYCSGCHGADGTGGHGGGSGITAASGAPVAIAAITNGKNRMPAFRDILSADQVRDVVAYVLERLDSD